MTHKLEVDMGDGTTPETYYTTTENHPSGQILIPLPDKSVPLDTFDSYHEQEDIATHVVFPDTLQHKGGVAEHFTRAPLVMATMQQPGQTIEIFVPNPSNPNMKPTIFRITRL